MGMVYPDQRQLYPAASLTLNRRFVRRAVFGSDEQDRDWRSLWLLEHQMHCT